MRAGGSGDSLGCGKGNTETLELDDTLWGRGAQTEEEAGLP